MYPCSSCCYTVITLLMPLHMAFLANNCPTLLTSLKLYQIESQPKTISTISLLDQLWCIIDQKSGEDG